MVAILLYHISVSIYYKERLTIMNNIIPIFYGIDDYYAPLLSVSLGSMIKNASKDYHYQIVVLYQTLSDENQAKIKALENENFSISFEPIDKNFKERFGNDNNSLRCDYFTLTIYYRLFIADMFPQYDKGIYLDADTVVPGDISKLYQIDLKDNLVAGCSDTFVESDPVLVNYAEKCSGVPVETYINSGVLLMNLKQFRDLKFTKRFLDILNTYHPKTVAPDQDYLNAIANNHVLKISQNWNAMPAKKETDPQIIHYNLYLKPWHYEDVLYGDVFWDYAKESNYYDELVNIQKNYSDKDKQTDKEKMDTLMEQVQEIPAKELTLYKLNQEGKQIRL